MKYLPRKIHIFSPAMTSVEVGEVGRAEPAVVRLESHLHLRVAVASLRKGLRLAAVARFWWWSDGQIHINPLF